MIIDPISPPMPSVVFHANADGACSAIVSFPNGHFNVVLGDHQKVSDDVDRLVPPRPGVAQ